MKRYRLREEMNGIDEPPGKVWFWELAAGVIDADRCIQCGTCVAACPSNSIGVNEDTGLPELVKMCTGCSLCWDFCPAAGCATRRCGRRRRRSSPRTRAPVTCARTPRTPTSRSPAGPPADGLGAVARAATRSGPRHACEDVQDGGAVSAAAHRAARGRRDQRRPRGQAERRPRGALEGRRHHRPHPRGGAGRRRQLLQPDHGPRRARPRQVPPRAQPPHRGGRHARARSRASGRCRPVAGRPGPTGSTRSSSPSR